MAGHGRVVLATVLLGASACRRDASSDAPRDVTKADTSTRAISAAAPGTSITVATFDGVGRARIGTTMTQLRDIGPIPDEPAAAGCRIIPLEWLPAGVRVMLSHDTIARVDVDSTSTVRTVDGAGVGDSETRIRQLYTKVQTQPHKYVTNGHYLSVASPNDSTRRIVFETDGITVRRYRVGRQPEVDFVEGCG